MAKCVRKRVDVAFSQLVRMGGGVKRDEAANPVDEDLLGASAVNSAPQDFYHAVIEPRDRLAREQPQR